MTFAIVWDVEGLLLFGADAYSDACPVQALTKLSAKPSKLFTDSAFATPFDPRMLATADLSVYAKWTEKKTDNTKTDTTDNGDNGNNGGGADAVNVI